MPTWNRVVVEDNSGNASITGNTLTFANAESINNTTNGTIEIDADIAKVKDIYITDGEILVPVSGTPTSIMSWGALTGTVAGDTNVLQDLIVHGNSILGYESGEANAHIELDGAATGDVAITGDVIVTGNIIKSGTLASPTTAITLSGANVTMADDLTVTDDLNLGGDSVLNFGSNTSITNSPDAQLNITGQGGLNSVSGVYKINGSTVLQRTSSTNYLQNIDALDATTDATIEAAMDELDNLVSIGKTGVLTTVKGTMQTNEDTTLGNAGTGDDKVHIHVGDNDADFRLAVNSNIMLRSNDTAFNINEDTDLVTLNIGNANHTTNIIGNLSVSGTTTTIQTANLSVEDKNIVLGVPDSAFANDAAAVAANTGAGISIVTDEATAGNYANLTWTSGAVLTGWQVEDTANAGSFDIAVQTQSTAAGTGDGAGVGTIHFDTSAKNLYIRTA